MKKKTEVKSIKSIEKNPSQHMLTWLIYTRDNTTWRKAKKSQSSRDSLIPNDEIKKKLIKNTVNPY